MSRARSTYVGRDKRTGRRVYQAIMEYACTRCGEPIRNGELFVRQALGRGGTGPVCSRCSGLTVS